MNSVPVEFARWTPRRWLSAIGLAFLAHVILICALAERPHHSGPAPQFGANIRLAIDSDSEKQLAQSPLFADPTLFALPSLQGFSGRGWLSFALPQHQFTDWTQSEQWLELDKSSLGATFLAFASSNVRAPFLIADKPLPSVSGPGVILTNLSPVIATSELRLEGDLAHRSLLNRPMLTNWTYADILTNTVVQLLVDANGDTQSSTLLASCGLNEADELALKIAGRARFEPLRQKSESAAANPISWGKMIFHWQTVAPPATNALFNAPLR